MSTLTLALRTRTFRSLRRHRNYRIFFTGQLVSLAGSWMQNVALAWLVIELSGSPLAHPAQQPSAGRRQHQPDAAAVLRGAHALHELQPLQPVDRPGQRRGRYALLGGQLAQVEARPRLDQPQERHLPARDAELLGLLAQPAGQPQQHRAKLVREHLGRNDNRTIH